MRTKKGRADRQSGYRGVVWSKSHERWVARYSWNHRLVLAGYFDCPHEAAIALSQAVIDREQAVIRQAQQKRKESLAVSKALMDADFGARKSVFAKMEEIY